MIWMPSMVLSKLFFLTRSPHPNAKWMLRGSRLSHPSAHHCTAWNIQINVLTSLTLRTKALIILPFALICWSSGVSRGWVRKGGGGGPLGALYFFFLVLWGWANFSYCCWLWGATTQGPPRSNKALSTSLCLSNCVISFLLCWKYFFYIQFPWAYYDALNITKPLILFIY